MPVPYRIISTGSKGNAVIVDHRILIDCGVPYKLLEPYVQDFKLVLLTHIHGDHFRPSTLRRLAEERPTLRFGCCRWLVRPLLEAGVRKSQIDVYRFDTRYAYFGLCTLTPVALTHDVPNCGYKLHLPAGKVIYATDTANLNGITAWHYDLYLIEANHGEAEIQARIDAKKEQGEYPYELRAREQHLSVEQCNDFIYKNIGPGGEYVYLHGHVDEEGTRTDAE